MRVVQKYGGSSVATVEQIKNISKNIRNQYLQGDELVIVVSAMGKTTNGLIGLAKSTSESPNVRDLDFLLSTGEMVSAALMSIALNDSGVPAVCLTGWQSGINTNSCFGKAFITDINTQEIEDNLAKGKVVVVTGFQGVDMQGNITTLGRGGSDTTAVALAAVLNAHCEIYTDVESVCFIDPKKCNKTKKIHKIDYRSMLTLASSGAKVLDVRCLEIGSKYKVNLYLGKTGENNKDKGTYVMNNIECMEEMQILGVAVLDDLCLYKFTDFSLDTLLENTKSYMQNLDLFLLADRVAYVSTKNMQLSMVGSETEKCQKFLKISKITIAGVGFVTHSDVVYNAIEVLKNAGVNVVHFYVTETALYIFVNGQDEKLCVEKIMEIFDGKEN